MANWGCPEPGAPLQGGHKPCENGSCSPCPSPLHLTLVASCCCPHPGRLHASGSAQVHKAQPIADNLGTQFFGSEDLGKEAQK